MSPVPPEQFTREHGCTDAEWRGWLPGAVGPHALDLGDGCTARVTLGAGVLHLQWQVLEPRRIALFTLPRMTVDYRFDAVPPAERQAFLRYFDLFMQRGGG